MREIYWGYTMQSNTMFRSYLSSLEMNRIDPAELHLKALICQEGACDFPNSEITALH